MSEDIARSVLAEMEFYVGRWLGSEGLPAEDEPSLRPLVRVLQDVREKMERVRPHFEDKEKE